MCCAPGRIAGGERHPDRDLARLVEVVGVAARLAARSAGRGEGDADRWLRLVDDLAAAVIEAGQDLGAHEVNVGPHEGGPRLALVPFLRATLACLLA